MEIELNRTQSNHLYTEGVLFINGIKYAHTEEHTYTMPQPGVYDITRSNLREYFGIGNSWRDALSQNRIILGDPVIPGVVIHSRHFLDRLHWRIKKCKRPVTLTITDSRCQEVPPISHWLK